MSREEDRGARIIAGLLIQIPGLVMLSEMFPQFFGWLGFALVMLIGFGVFIVVPIIGIYLIVTAIKENQNEKETNKA